jgi:hypothetical protein
MALLVPNPHRPPRDRRPGDQRAILCALLVLAAGWIAGTPVSRAQEPVYAESQAKAAYLINFAKYVDWPAEAFAEADSPIVIAVLGDAKVAEETRKTIAGRMVNGRAMVVRQLAAGEEPGQCHILFISAAEQQRSPSLLAKAKDGVLTVGETGDFLERGGIINLARRGQNLALEINVAAAAKARLTISSKLLAVARVVKGKAK